MLEYPAPMLLKRDRVSGGQQRTIDLRSIRAQSVCDVDVVVDDLSARGKQNRRVGLRQHGHGLGPGPAWAKLYGKVQETRPPSSSASRSRSAKDVPHKWFP